MIFKVYYAKEHMVFEDLVYFDCMSDLIEHFNTETEVRLIYAKEVVGHDEIQEFNCRYR